VVDDGTHAADGVAALEWLAATLGSGAVAAGGTGARNSANDDAQSDNDDNEPASVLEAILGRQVGQREDTAGDEDGVDVSVGVNVVAVVGVGVHGQICQSRCQSRCQYSCRCPLPHFHRLLGSLSEIWESYDFNCHLPS